MIFLVLGSFSLHLTSSNLKLSVITETFNIPGLGGRVWVRDFAYSQNIDFPESFILLFFTRKVRTVTLSVGDYTLSRLQNDKTSNIWKLFSATSTFSLKLVAEWRRLPRFPISVQTRLPLHKLSSNPFFLFLLCLPLSFTVLACLKGH